VAAEPSSESEPSSDDAELTRERKGKAKEAEAQRESRLRAEREAALRADAKNVRDELQAEKKDRADQAKIERTQKEQEAERWRAKLAQATALNTHKPHVICTETVGVRGPMEGLLNPKNLRDAYQNVCEENARLLGQKAVTDDKIRRLSRQNAILSAQLADSRVNASNITALMRTP
jgi:hypothetical protein